MSLFIRSPSAIKKTSRYLLPLYQSYLKVSTAHHEKLADFSFTLQHNLTNTQARFSSSVYIFSPVTAHSKKLGCWINTEFYRKFSSEPRQKCILSPELAKNSSSRQVSQQSTKMVWISDLDNPQVLRRNFLPLWSVRDLIQAVLMLWTFSRTFNNQPFGKSVILFCALGQGQNIFTTRK